ncbi:allene oxide synthase-lipoxygenase protein-like isoform X3 [Oculina patagonica]
MEAVDVGDILMIKVKNDQGGFFHRSSDLFLDEVSINYESDTRKVFEFPCYCWVQSESVFFEGKAKLITDEQNDVVRDRRRQEVKERQNLYHWGDDPDYQGLPGFIKSKTAKTLPKDVQFTQEDADQLLQAKHKGIFNTLSIKFRGLFHSWEKFEDFCKAFVHFVGDVPLAAEHWKTDSFYGAQFLNGCNPDTIKRCTKLPSKFPVTQEMIGNLLDSGDTLQQAMKEGRVYLVDYEILVDIPHYGTLNSNLERRYTCPALGLFYVKSSGDIVPIAIQLHQKPSKENPIWTPNDDELEWIYAKMWLRNADAQWHQMITHLLRTHLFMEPIAVATRRQLPSLHPLWKLLSPHLRGILAINTLGRERLIPAGGVADYALSIGGGGHVHLMQKYYKSLTWSSYDLPRVLEERGVHDADKLPGFHYRDDALRLWQIIKEYVTDILNVYYHSDNDIKKDIELQAWILDLHDNGYPAREGENDHGFPSSVTSLEQLAHLLTMTIFTCSCQHAAVNFSQMDAYGFQPHSPSLMRKPPPTKKGLADMEHIMSSLPSKDQAGATIAVVFDLTRQFDDEPHLGEFPERLFTDKAAEEAISRFKEKLDKVSMEIIDRNNKSAFPYTYLLPENTPNSVAI